ncbi:integrase [Zoogloea oleivorans]|uniref:Integrase n=1 Tax=Zoogloea oleivorans TaxID=1552750 RepID=A0A6C2CG17_9RHOO|nr:phage integrase family protein [Zoogloea oleivorans]TYC52931.1 integrase [Zoogloea oleivorans]
MAQNIDVASAIPRYTRADFTALRASLNKLPIAFIASNYYTEEDLEALGCETLAGLQDRLDAMRDHLVERASVANPHSAEGLRNARKSARWSQVALKYLFQAAEFSSSQPQRQDALSAWLKPRVARHLRNEGVRTLQDLLTLIEARGPTWWRPIPRLGQGKAGALLRWLTKHEQTLGVLSVEDTKQVPMTGNLVPITLRPSNPILVPLEGMLLPGELDGSQGLNRAPHFSLIEARNDLEAIESYLIKFRAQEKTRRAYRRELERLLLWSIYKRKKPLSSLLVEDSEAFKDFLAEPDPTWCGPKTSRWSVRWKPFEGTLSPKSQLYAITVIRAFFAWLVNVRYLGGNPWVAIGNPVTEVALLPMQIDKALPEALWSALAGTDGYLDQAIRNAEAKHKGQLRLAKAALLLIGHSGLRREEAATAKRENLKKIQGHALYELAVLGKRSKWRTVFLPSEVVHALQTHWCDRGDDQEKDGFVLSPLVIPPTTQAIRKHLAGDNNKGKGFSVDGLGRLITRSLKQVADDVKIAMSDAERESLATRGVHAFRHTFGTLSVAKGLPLDVLQRVLGHASLQTTSIYVQAERQRSIEEMGLLFERQKTKNN